MPHLSKLAEIQLFNTFTLHRNSYLFIPFQIFLCFKSLSVLLPNHHMPNYLKFLSFMSFCLFDTGSHALLHLI